MLTGYNVETVKQSEWEKTQPKEEKLLLSQIPELTKTIVEKLNAAGYESAEEVLDAGKDTIMELKGFGEKTAARVFEILGSCYEEEPLKDRGTMADGSAVEDKKADTGPEGSPETPAEASPQDDSKPVGDSI